MGSYIVCSSILGGGPSALIETPFRPEGLVCPLGLGELEVAGLLGHHCALLLGLQAGHQLGHQSARLLGVQVTCLLRHVNQRGQGLERQNMLFEETGDL